jgi:hypothetical protein
MRLLINEGATPTGSTAPAIVPGARPDEHVS